jgi:hypothetical protein
MNWLLLNLLVAAPFFAIWVGVPLWLVFKHPDEDARPRATSGGSQPQAVTSPAPQASGRPRRPAIHAIR